MTALSADRPTPRRLPSGWFEQPVAASQRIFTGALVARNAAGFLVKGAAATGLIGVGTAMRGVDNSAGDAGDARAQYSSETARFANSGSGDAITIAEIGDICWIVDDQTVAKTDGSGTRSPAGIVEEVDAQGVWVRFDEGLLRSYVATRTAVTAEIAAAIAAI